MIARLPFTTAHRAQQLDAWDGTLAMGTARKKLDS
jgi:hypothetical protein